MKMASVADTALNHHSSLIMKVIRTITLLWTSRREYIPRTWRCVACVWWYCSIVVCVVTWWLEGLSQRHSRYMKPTLSPASQLKMVVDAGTAFTQWRIQGGGGVGGLNPPPLRGFFFLLVSIGKFPQTWTLTPPPPRRIPAQNPPPLEEFLDPHTPNS